jgi:murein DD-endopeptidase MepM/ murein hydrolase activator NlpD
VLIAAALTTVIAVAALLVLSRDDSGAGDPRPDRDGPAQYTVREGDTLTAVADLHGLPVADLMDALGLTLADSLEPGDVLEIPPAPVAGHAWPHRLVDDPIRAQQNVWFEHWAAAYHVPTPLLQALAWNISSWDNTTVSGDGDMGIGRIDLELVGWINDELIDDETRVDPRSPEGNVQLMAAYLGHLLEVTGGDHANAVATYFLDRQEPTDAAWDLGLRSFVTGVLARVPDFEAPPPPSATTTTTTTAPD